MKKKAGEPKAYLRQKRAKDFAFALLRGVILAGLSLVILTPLLFMISYAFRARADMNDPTVMWIPKHLTLDVMRETIHAMHLDSIPNNPLLNTIFITTLCAAGQVFSCALAGYGFARFEFAGRSVLFGIVILMILVPAQVISIPLSMTMRNFLFGAVNLLDSPLALILPAMTANGLRAGLMIYLFRQFFKALPTELEDAAACDGAGAARTFFSVMLPNAKAVWLTVLLFSIVFYWNDFYLSGVFFSSTRTLPLELVNLPTSIASEIYHSPGVSIAPREQIVWLEAGCLLAVAPMLILYAALRGRFTEGIAQSGLAEG